MFKKTTFGVPFFFGQLIDLKTSKHGDKNLFEKILRQKPIIKVMRIEKGNEHFSEG